MLDPLMVQATHSSARLLPRYFLVQRGSRSFKAASPAASLLAIPRLLLLLLPVEAVGELRTRRGAVGSCSQRQNRLCEEGFGWEPTTWRLRCRHLQMCTCTLPAGSPQNQAPPFC